MQCVWQIAPRVGRGERRDLVSGALKGKEDEHSNAYCMWVPSGRSFCNNRRRIGRRGIESKFWSVVPSQFRFSLILASMHFFMIKKYFLPIVFLES